MPSKKPMVNFRLSTDELSTFNLLCRGYGRQKSAMMREMIAFFDAYHPPLKRVESTVVVEEFDAGKAAA